MILGYISIEAQVLLFLFFALTIAVLLKQIQKKYSFISYTPTLFIVSVILGYFAEYQGILGDAIKQVSSIDPRGILIIFLPPLIFEGAFNSDWHIFRKQAPQIFILAFPSVIVSAMLIMFSIKVVIVYDDSYYNWPQAFTFGSILSCTDTVAVLALLKQAGAPKKFNSLIQGQSLFNDGTCMVLLTISFEILKGNDLQPLSIVILFIQLTLGGILLGIIFGFISTILIKWVKNDSVLTLNITLAACYLLYFTAQYVDLGIRVSGIMSLVSMGLYMAVLGKTKIPAQTRQRVNSFWKIVIFVTESTIFIMGGVLVGTKVLNNKDFDVVKSADGFKLIALYGCMTAARFISIAIFMPRLKKEGYGLKWNQVFILTYGGLRGAVGIAFALILAADTSLSQKFTFICLFNMAGCSILTLVINASTAGFVIKAVGLCVRTQIKTKLFNRFLIECSKDLQLKLQQLKKNKYLQNANWQKVYLQSGIQQLDNKIKSIKKKIKLSQENQKSNNMQSSILTVNLFDQMILQQNDQPLMMELRNRFCVTLKGILWEKFQDNQCSSQSIRVLIEGVDWDLDTLDQPLNSWQYMISHIHNPYFFSICFWWKKYPIIGSIADSMIIDRATFIYDVVSTYIQALSQCQHQSHQFQVQQIFLNKLIQQSQQNRRLAQTYLDYQIKISYPQIRKRIQTDKASQSILNYQKIKLKQTYKYGQLDQQFYKILKFIIENNSNKVQNQTGRSQVLKDSDIILTNQFFKQLQQKDAKQLLSKKFQLVIQKDQTLIKSYQRQKYLYLITRGQVAQQVKQNNKTISKQSHRIFQFVGLNSLVLSNRKNLQHSAVANSISCLYCFPLQDIRQLLIKYQKLQGILYKQVLPCLSKIDQSFSKFKLSDNTWSSVKQSLIFNRCAKNQTHGINNKIIVLIEGKILIGENQYSTGYYNVKDGQNCMVKGPAKYFEVNKSSLTGQRANISQINRNSQLKRKTHDDRVYQLMHRAAFT